jgi:hypothetical protein
MDIWMKSGQPAGDHAPWVGASKHTLYGYKHASKPKVPVA